ncbi:NAD-dependent dehydratase [Devosia limi DSM 17137]|uniref:NAD-dependent dehydratase n=2 Tax=Devosia limi DSM 17137 TaxID=1121477 RepID=A0A0F5LP90_9HYPH|nr:NAD-dependent dehydratase [Devosia limi DSM 17137]
MIMTKRILISGGAGFLGANLCRKLLAQGHAIVCLDNFRTGAQRNIADLLGHPRFTLLQQDVSEPVTLAVDQIYNLACPASPVHYQADPIATFKTSVLGAINMLDLARRLDVPVLQASTSEVYGDPHIHPQPEGYWGNVNPIGPRACYDEGKRSAETLFFDYHRQHGVAIKVARIFNTYGPGMHPADGRVVANFIVQALQGDAITLYGDGRQTRSFCYVDDLLDGLVMLMNSGPEVTGPVNLGNPTEFTMRELAAQVIALTRSRSRLVQRPLPIDDPRQRRPDISLAMHSLGWSPRVELDAGLRQTIAYFEAMLADTAIPA